MSGYNQTLITAQVDGTALTNSTTPTSILPPAARLVLPTNFFFIGKRLRIEARGRISTVVTTPGTLTLDVRLGSIATPIVVFNGGAMNLNTTAQTNASWELEATLTCRAIGNGTVANLMGVGSFASRALIGSPAVAAGSPGIAILPDTAPAVGTGFNSADVTNVVDLFATWSIANASNSIQVHDYAVTDLNWQV
jgi:hypothetical protein